MRWSSASVGLEGRAGVDAAGLEVAPDADRRADGVELLLDQGRERGDLAGPGEPGDLLVGGAPVEHDRRVERRVDDGRGLGVAPLQEAAHGERRRARLEAAGVAQAEVRQVPVLGREPGQRARAPRAG